ncbi:MAG: DUF4255 domain-containing protein [Mangrovibacterium sp.]|nr:DUF4255 domain-containing protein [Mangrovibacterium sp.]
MINETLKFLLDEVNLFLSLKLGATTDPRLVLGNVTKAMDSDGGGTNSLSNKGILSLVNVEEDRIARQQDNLVKTESSVSYKSPPIYLNLYVIFAINLTEYAESLKWLACIIQFFQYQRLFTPLSHPSLDSRIRKIVPELHSMSFEQMNHLWSILGGKYLPSAMYKIRQISLDEDATIAGGGVITEVDLNGRNKIQVS